MRTLTQDEYIGLTSPVGTVTPCNVSDSLVRRGYAAYTADKSGYYISPLGELAARVYRAAVVAA